MLPILFNSYLLRTWLAIEFIIAWSTSIPDKSDGTLSINSEAKLLAVESMLEKSVIFDISVSLKISLLKAYLNI